MTLKILLFEDNPEHIKNLKLAFGRGVKWKAFNDLRYDWDESSERAKEIVAFKPDLAIVDLDDQSRREIDAGFRIIRKVNELLNADIPVFAWSYLLPEKTDDGKNLRKKVCGYGAIPVHKPPRKKHYDANEFLQKANLLE
jgi:hypothetical protein